MKQVTAKQRRKTAHRLRVLRAQMRKVEQLFHKLTDSHAAWKLRAKA